MEIKEALTYWQEKLNAFEEFDPNDFFLEEYRQAHTNYLEAIRAAISALKFKNYFCSLYGQGLEVANWHMNGTTEPLDNFIDSAEE